MTVSTDVVAAPLDLGTEFFTIPRQSLISKRLNEIADGRHLEIIREVDSRERPKATICIGANWERLSGDDILEIAEVGYFFRVRL